MKTQTLKTTGAVLVAAITAMFVLALQPPVLAAPEAELDPATVTAARKLLTTMKVEEQMKPALDSVMQMQDAMLAQTGMTAEEQERTKKVLAASMDETKKALSWEHLEPLMIRVYASVFTADELDRLSAFFASEDGQVFIAKQPELQKAMMGEMGKIMGELMPKIQQRTMEAIMEVQKGEGK